MNTLLLAMSTLNLKKEKNDQAVVDEYFYQNVETNKGFVSGSQLVPGTEYIASYLEDAGEKIDRIIVINTNATLKNASLTIKKENRSIDFGSSAYDYYKKNVLNYLNCEECKDERVTKLKESYETNDDIFNSINRDEKNLGPDQYLWKVADAIKEEKSDGTVNLYVDTQGGDRNAIVEINAVIDLLRNRGVTVKKRIAVDFNRENPIQYIRTVDSRYKTYELFSAMQSFEKFGIATELVDFFEEDKPNIIQTIQNLTESIQLCDMNTFDKTIRALADQVKVSANTNDTKLNIVHSDIYGNYKDIIDRINANQSAIIEEIKWCADKGYLQQALTLIESKALKVIYDKKIMYWDDNFEVNVKEINERGNFVESDTKEVQKEVINKAKLDWESPINYVFVKWIQNYITQPDYKKYKENPRDSSYIKDTTFKSAYIKLDELTVEDIPDSISSNVEESHHITIKWPKNLIKYSAEVCVKFKNDHDLYKFLRLHAALKNLRNTINHASDNSERRSTYDSIRNAILIYVNIAKKLMENPDK